VEVFRFLLRLFEEYDWMYFGGFMEFQDGLWEDYGSGKRFWGGFGEFVG